MSDVMDQFHTVGASLANKLSSSCKKDYEKLGQAAAAMAEATTFDSSNGNQKLLQALRVSSSPDQGSSPDLRVEDQAIWYGDPWIPAPDSRPFFSTHGPKRSKNHILVFFC